MCGLAGFFSLDPSRPLAVGTAAVQEMMDAIAHRGPDGCGQFVDHDVAMGFRRLSIIGRPNGEQPIFNEDGSVLLICNGELFNEPELRRSLVAKGHVFATGSDVEAIVHLYEEQGIDCIRELNGQFAFALFDRRLRRLWLGRDRFGIAPLYYTQSGTTLVFASEIKSLLRYPEVQASVDLTGLDQVLCFPGLVSPRTMFTGVSSLQPGHYVEASTSVQVREYWDLDYPRADEDPEPLGDEEWVNGLSERLTRAVAMRMRSEVPVGVYLSGGIDSSLLAAMMRQAEPHAPLRSFSVAFPEADLDERPFQHRMVSQLRADHREILFRPADIADRLQRMVRHAECPVKETYNACCLALSEQARADGVRVILMGDGSDELFAGYPGYRFDQSPNNVVRSDVGDAIAERGVRNALWGAGELLYEKALSSFREVTLSLYAAGVATSIGEFDCLARAVVRTDRIAGRHVLHQRSYLDVKLRLADHLLGDHGDRMALANGVEVRYPFLDDDVVDFARRMPPHLKLRDLCEKWVVKRVAEPLLPRQIIARDKQGFRAVASPALLRTSSEWIDDMLSYDRVRRQGYFNAMTVERLKKRARDPAYSLHPHAEDDLLLVVVTFGAFLDAFGMS